MAGDAERGVRFVLKSDLENNFKAPFTEAGKLATALQRQLDGLKIGIKSTRQDALGDLAKQVKPIQIRTELAPNWKQPFGTLHAELQRLQQAATVKLNVQSTAAAVRQPASTNRITGFAGPQQAPAEQSMGSPVAISTALAPGWDQPFKRIRAEIEALRKSATISVQTTGGAAVGAGQSQSGRRSKSGRVVGFAGGVGAGDETDVDQVARAQQKIAELRKKAQAEQDRDDQREAERKRRAAEREERDEKKRLAANLKREEKYHADLAKAQETTRKTLAREAEAATGKLITKQDEFRERTMAAMGAVVTMGRGIATLGLVGQEDMQKLTDGILKVFGAVDVLRGGIQVFHEMSRGARTYRDILQLTAESERAVAAARAGGGIAQAVGGVAGAAGAAGNASTAFMLGSLARSAGAAATRIGAIAAPAVAVAGALTALAAAGKIAYNAATGDAGERYDKGHRHYRGESRRAYTATEYALKSDSGDTMESYGSLAAHIVQGKTSLFGRWLVEHDPFGRQERYANGQVVRDRTAYKTDAELDKIHEARVAAREKTVARMHERERLTTERFQGENAQHDRRLELQTSMNAMRFQTNQFQTPEQRQLAQKRQLAADRLAIQDRRRAADAQLQETIGPNGRVGAGRAEALRAREQVERQIIELQKREIELARQKRDIDISAGVEKLRLAKQAADQAKDKFTQRLQGVENFQERLGRMTPKEVARLAEAKKAAESGKRLKDKQLEILELGDQRSQDLAKQEYRRRGRQFNKEFAGGELGGIERLKADAAMGQASRSANARDTLKQQLERDLNVKLKTTVDNNVKVEVTGGDKLEQKLIDAYQHAMQDFMRDQADRIEGYLRDADSRMDKKVSASIRRQNQQNRQLA